MSYSHPPTSVFLALRAIIFFIGYGISSFVFGLLAVFVGWPLSMERRQKITSGWCRLMLWWTQITCGVRYEVSGLDNIPDGPCVVVSNHQSAWETLIFQVLFIPSATVLKKELLRIPGFGWGLAMTQPIVIDRSQKTNALKQVLQQGKVRLAENRWVLIFPEGTRQPAGQLGEFSAGGAMLANKAGVSVLPIAHNAGTYWPKSKLVKFPGTVKMHIGAPISSDDKPVKQLNREALDAISELYAALD